MRVATFEQDGRTRSGAVIDGDDKVVDLDAAFLRRHGRAEPALASMLALIDAASAGRAVAVDLPTAIADMITYNGGPLRCLA